MYDADIGEVMVEKMEPGKPGWLEDTDILVVIVYGTIFVSTTLAAGLAFGLKEMIMLIVKQPRNTKNKSYKIPALPFVIKKIK